jgi:16S rRNA (adenine1518-N6/adenine1519-N6)-dimethyltransferase
MASDRPPAADDWLRRMRAWGIRPARSKGQNFLLDAEIVERIAAASGAEAGDRVLEIGPGLGILTEAMLRRGSSVTAIELDDLLAQRLETHITDEPRFRLVHGDATAIDPADIYEPGQRYRIVANLPYGVATVIIRHFLESVQPPSELVVMVQKEVAERMTAGEGDLSLLTLAIQLYTEPEYLFTVPREAFHPAPKVTSAVVRLRVRHALPLDPPARDRLFALATFAFQQKRKTLLNSLARGLEVDKGALAGRLATAGIDGGLRPQALSFDDWLRLASTDLAP